MQARRPDVAAIDPRHPDPSLVGDAARVLAAGGLVAFPTETVYGLGARAFDAAALARLFVVKQRPRHHPLIAHVESEAQAAGLAAHWPEAASLLARALWPGPLTLVVERASHVDPMMAGGGTSIALRVPAHPIALALVRALGEPIAAPSANRFQCLSPTTASHVVDQLGGAVDLVIEGGPCDAGIESTVVDLRGVDRGELPRILRPGAATPDSIRRWLPQLGQEASVAAPDVARVSPGMDPRHYAPRARVIPAADAESARAAARARADGGERVGVVVWTPASTSDVARTEPRSHDRGSPWGARGRLVERVLPADPVGYARLLYATLHELDGAGVTSIVVERVPEDEAWWAVADRLARASFTGTAPTRA